MKLHPIIALVGDSGSGKTTLINEMLDRFPDTVRIIRSVTTRARRGLEDDLYYDFVSPMRFAQLRQEGDLLQEAEYGGNRYGTRRSHVDFILTRGFGINALVQQSVRDFRSAGYEVKIVFVAAEHQPEELQHRGDTKRAHDDAARAQVLLRHDAVIVNSFQPGGLVRATNELSAFIKSLS